MTKTLAEAAIYIDELLAFSVPAGVQPFVLPAATALASVRDRLPADSPLLLGVQNAHWGPEGAGTGEISMRMARDAGATLVEIGHSERRKHFGETDRTVALKVAAALAEGLVPLLCVGEPREIRDDGAAESFVEDQVRAALAARSPEEVAAVIVAYEPVWAIGESGTPATPEQTEPVMARIAEVVADHTVGGSARALLYGGSVDRDNAVDLLADSHTDGLFVGRAAWTAAGFAELLELCAPSSPREVHAPLEPQRST